MSLGFTGTQVGLTKKQIRALTKEQQRVDEIIKLQNKNKEK